MEALLAETNPRPMMSSRQMGTLKLNVTVAHR